MFQSIVAFVGPFVAYAFIGVILFILFVALPVSVFSWFRDMKSGKLEKRFDGARKPGPWKKN